LVSNNSTSTCGAPALVLSRTAFDCTDVGAPVPVVLTVTDGFGGTATASATVTVLAPPAATLTSLSPATSPVGTTVTVTGTNLAGATALTVNGAQALISNLTGNSLRFVVPAGATATGSLVLALPCGQVLSQPFSVGPLAARPATAAALTLYPNPTRNAVTVQGALPHATVEVFDLLGQRVLIASTAADGTARLALPVDLAAGVYVVRTGAQVRRLAVK
jgi:hypothetical protein